MNAIQEVVIVNGPSAPTTSKSLNVPLCLVVKGVTADDTMDDTADIPTVHDEMTPPVRCRAFTSGWNTAVVRETRSVISGVTPQKFIVINGLSLKVLGNN